MSYQIPSHVPAGIFRSYDIRGIVDTELTPDVIYAIGLSIGSEAHELGETVIAMGRDGRLSGPVLVKALQQGLLDSGLDVIDIGIVPSPVLYFATFNTDARSGVILTASHNPANFNGIKVVLNHETLAEQRIKNLYERIMQNNFTHGTGRVIQKNILPEYIAKITSDIRLKKKLKIAIDCGNGVTGVVAPELFKKLNCEVIELFCEVDGNFPNHHPDPTQEKNLKTLIATVLEKNADLGIAFDGDGDRIGIVTNKGEIIFADRQLMLYAIDVLANNSAAIIVFDVKCTANLAPVIEQHGGKPLMSKTGHALIKGKMIEVGAKLAGEMSGHIFFNDRWFGFDDGMYTAARLLEILANSNMTASELFKTLPDSINTPELFVPVSESEKFALIEKLKADAQFPNSKIITIDGVRAEFADGWGLVRASNTNPCLVLRFEATTHESLQRIKDLFKQQMLAIEPALKFPF